MTPNNERERSKGRIGKLLLNLFGIFGTLFGVWAFLQTREVRSMTYLPQFPSKVFDSDSTTRINVTDARGEPIENDIYLQEIILWNSGNQPLNVADVRRPIEISLEGDPFVEILDFRVASQTQNEIPQFRFQRTRCCHHRLLVNWKYFDPNQGARFHIIYQTLNEEPLDIALSGTILGVEGFIDGSEERAGQLIPWLPPLLTLIFLFGLWLVLIAVVIILGNHYLQKWRVPDMVQLILVLLLIGVQIYATSELTGFLIADRNPPF